MSQATAASVRHLMIVSRDRPDLYDRFADRFGADGSVEVILDRRSRDRRHDDLPRVGDRRGTDRRTPSMAGDAAALWLPGYMLVRASR